MKENNSEMHVFHQGSTEAYSAFISKNRDRILRQDIADDRVLVWCRPDVNQETQVFISGHFPR